ncbi:hypothetical protein MSPP1_001193 [Malassezia sp. CBS 17886]|nr:hypothetical protein MSPP1_001193 [Malassezia sp. CBS 17886]
MSRGTTQDTPLGTMRDLLQFGLGQPLRVHATHRSFTAPAYAAAAETIVGRLWAYDAALDLVVLETGNTSALPAGMQRAAAAFVHEQVGGPAAAQTSAASGALAGFKMVRGVAIASVEALSEEAYAAAQAADATYQPHTALSSVAPVPVESMEARGAAAVKKSSERAQQLGPKSVTDEGQRIFDALSKTLPCRWHDIHIIVLDEVVIGGPSYVTHSTYVPGLSREQLDGLLAEDRSGEDVPSVERAQAKAMTWQRVTKVVSGGGGLDARFL